VEELPAALRIATVVALVLAELESIVFAAFIFALGLFLVLLLFQQSFCICYKVF